MSCYLRALVSLLLASLATLGAAGCTLGPSGDYEVAVSWLINGATANESVCSEHRIARFRFEVRTGGGRKLKTVEADCASSIRLDDGKDYGGFFTSASFDWDADYYYALTPVDAAGNALSPAAESEFRVAFDTADVYETGTLDYLDPAGNAASLAGEWRIGNASDVQAACLAQDIKTVRILVATALDTDLVNVVPLAEVPCGDGKFVSNGKVLARGFYNFFYEAISSGGSVVADGDPIQLLVDGSKDVVLPREAFLSN